MEHFEKILRLDNAFEAERMREVLEQSDIPYSIIERTDSSLGGISEMEFGWGYVEAPPDRRNDVLNIYKEITGK